MKILHLEDNPHDAALVYDILVREWPGTELKVVDNRDAFIAALNEPDLDVILSDFRLPGFTGREALAMVRERRPGVPFIFLSGTIGEDTAVESVRGGAADYLLKDRLQRLPMALRRALDDRDQRQHRHQAEDRLREQAELLDKVQDGIIVTDFDHRVIYWSRGAERLVGWSFEEVANRNFVDLAGLAAARAIKEMVKQLEARGEWRGEISLLDKQRNSQLVEMRVTTIRDENGAPKSWLTIITDISERKRLEEQLLRAQRLESLGMLAAGIAHDLNNALAPMLMAGGLLRARVHDPSDLRLVTLLEQSAERGAAMVKQIVSFAGGRDRQRVLLQVKHVVRDVLQLLQDTFPKSIRIEHDLPNSIWAVRGDPTQLHQVLLNLCINARDAMPHGGTLNLIVRNEVVSADTAHALPGATPGRFVLIEVRDSGSGIPAELIEQIWQPFFTTKSEGKGTGLGLSTVRGIVANHGGFLAVESASGRGATFRVYLPAEADATDAPTSSSAGAQPARRSTGELVLVVDDQATVRESINAVLTQFGYRLLTAADGIEVLSKFADRMRDVALVITDLDMPGLNGVALSQAILHLNPAVRILFISGTGEIVAAKRVKTGANSAFLAKPFTPTALLAKVDSLLDPAKG
jgi:two-component system, cell cycle sensor histidine kinase and response regulator CckA